MIRPKEFQQSSSYCIVHSIFLNISEQFLVALSSVQLHYKDVFFHITDAFLTGEPTVSSCFSVQNLAHHYDVALHFGIAFFCYFWARCYIIFFLKGGYHGRAQDTNPNYISGPAPSGRSVFLQP